MDTTWNEERGGSRGLQAAQAAQSGPVAVPSEAGRTVQVPGNAPRKRSRALIVGPALAVAAGLVALTVWWLGRGKESTDDAQIEGRVVAVSPHVSAQVKKVLIKDNQLVKAGEPLVELDDRDLLARQDAAHADLAAAQAAARAARAQLALTQRTSGATLSEAQGGVHQAGAGISTSQANVASARADVAAAKARLALAQTEMKRVKNLFDQGAVSRAELDTRQSTIDQAVANYDLAKARLVSAEQSTVMSVGSLEVAKGRMASAEGGPEQIELAQAQVDSADARVKQAAAAAAMADLNESYTKISAPVGGVVSRRSVEEGQMVSPDRPLLALIPSDDVWVVANFKEDQLADVRPNQKADVTIDTYGKTLPAHVDSVAEASGARFSLLPPDNSTGNYIKVVQRIPVLLRFDDRQGLDLKPGMSVNVTIHTAP